MRKHKKLLALTVSVLLSLTMNSNCQELTPEASLDHEVVTPEAYKFLKYGEFPISTYTGTPDISISLYTIEQGDIKLPITLRYHAGGIKVTEEASWVGLGWNLQFGNIVQITQDKDDMGTLPMNRPDYLYTSLGVRTPRKFEESYLDDPEIYHIRDPFFSAWIYEDGWWPKNKNGVSDFSTLLNNDDTKDTEPDIFKANFSGHSLKFIIDPQTNQPVLLNDRGYSIALISDGENLGWKIITPKGIEYHFMQITKIIHSPTGWNIKLNQYGADYNTYFSDSLMNNHSFGDGTIDINGNPYKTSRIWKITKIVDKYGKTINFSYNSTVNKLSDYTLTFNWEIYEAIQIRKGGMGGELGLGPVSIDSYSRPVVEDSTIYNNISKVERFTNTHKKYLKRIEYSGNIIEFNHSERLDYEGSRKLDAITIRNNHDTVVNAIDFQYEYFNSDYMGNGYSVDFKRKEELKKRLKLLSVQESGKNPFLFTYNSENLPPKNSYATDFWGYYNGETDNTSLLPNILRFPDFPDVSDSFYNYLNQNQNNHSAVLKYAKASILEEIKYPTGGITTFDYELNVFENSKVPNYNIQAGSQIPTDYHSKGMGLRIKRQSDWINASKSSSSVYEYENGITNTKLSFWDKYSEHNDHLNTSGKTLHKMLYNTYSTYSSNQNSPSLLGSGNYVGYGKVTIKKENSDGAYLGKTVKHYHNNEDIQMYMDMHKLNLPARTDLNVPVNGLQFKEEIYNDKGKKVQEKINSYDTYLPTRVFYGIKHSLLGKWLDVLYNGSLVNGRRKDLVAYYPIYGKKSLLREKVVTHFYKNGSNKVDIYRNSYNEDYLKRSSYKYDGVTAYTQEYFYPNDDLTGGFNSGQKTIIGRLDGNQEGDDHRIGEVVKTIEVKNGTILSRKVRYYKEENENIVPELIREDFPTGIKDTNIIFDKYDQYGNIIEYHKNNDYHTSRIWGYNYTYPILEAQNVSYDEIIDQLGENTLELLQGNSLSDKQIRDELGTLRSSFPQAQFTIYTYDPLVGMTSETDPAGKTKYYEYDAFGRLKTIKDHNQHIVKQFDYNYK